jgi:hypothetical protein
MVCLLWVGDRREVRELYPPDDESLDWLYALSEDDPRLLRATIIDRTPLEDDDDWDGPVYMMTDVILFRGYSVYPPCWYPEPARPEPPDEVQLATKKKGKKK